ncbi:hypothetical protein [Lewinella sp. W8]|uniref:hypothetical protein n=1 Tax=Lewinella sp. W8 TaxID=2528208 RepID=UPI0010673C73|nr:hypothetical protein [Lewinella sp. W8]MTB49480.1 hypothetical protein [Lewinella sp. W8]
MLPTHLAKFVTIAKTCPAPKLGTSPFLHRAPGLYLILCGLMVLLMGCEGPRDVRDFYFPVRPLEDGRVYAYENTGTLPGPDMEYTYYLGVDVDTALYLSVTRYGPDLSPQQQGREEITNDAVELRELTLFTTDSAGISAPIPTELIHDRTFPFYVDEATSEAYGYRIRFVAPDQPEVVNYVTLNRYFAGDTTVTVMGESYPAIRFNLEGEVSLRDPEEGDISPTFSGYEIYARGLGLVEYRRILRPGASLGGKLVESIPMPEFAERMKGM